MSEFGWHGAEAEVGEHPRPTSNKAKLDAGSNPTRRALSASPQRSDADWNPISFQVAGGAMDQTFLRAS